ncbi:MAG TPA: sensor histidine kinase [Catenuloplanes sp.]
MTAEAGEAADTTAADGDRWRRPPPTARQRRVDGYVGLALAVLVPVNLVLANSTGMYPLGPPPPWPEQLFWSLAVTVPLAWRRRWPEATTLLIAAFFIAGQARGNPETQVTSGALFTAIYTLGAWGRNHRLARRLRLAVIAAMFSWLGVSYLLNLGDIPPNSFPRAAGPIPPVPALIISSILTNALFFGFAWLFGEVGRTSARREYQLQVQAEALRRSQAQAGERAVMRERVRIARELHDVVAHHVSVMGVQASAGRRVLTRAPDQARTAFAAIEQSARTAVDELRRMLGVLRDSGDDHATAVGDGDGDGQRTSVGLDQLEELLTGARDAGLRVEYGVFGTPGPVPSSVSLAAYRVVQEAVTNTLKHAGAAVIDVRIRYLSSELEVDVTDDGRGVGSRDGSGSGYGLIGMRERVAAHDGTLEVGRREAGGFRVRARFPLANAEAALS